MESPVETVAEMLGGETPNQDVIEAGSIKVRDRYARECIGIATVELNRAYAEFNDEIPRGRILEAQRLLSAAIRTLDINDADLDGIPS